VDQYFYYPDHTLYQTPKADGYAYEEISFRSQDGTKLSGWFIPASGKALGTVIHFHGNAQNMSYHYPLVSFLPSMGFNLFVFDYRGYGISEGRPDRKGLYEDSVAAIEYVLSRKDIDQNKLFIFGQSLGGTNALAALGNNHFPGIRGVIIEATFYSYHAIVKDKFSALPSPASESISSTLTTDEYSACLAIDKISPVPLLLIHGTNDSVIPYAQSKALYEKAKEPKTLWTIEGGGHIEAFSKYKAEHAPKLEKFLLGCLDKEKQLR
jgi:fermentation-respiration switch protein FrsA (DUF1100 family)